MAAITRSLKALLTALLAMVIAWAFFDVARRAVGHWTALSERPVELTVLHWGDPSEDQIVDDLVKKFEAGHSNVRIVRINPGAGDSTPSSRVDSSNCNERSSSGHTAFAGIRRFGLAKRLLPSLA